MRDTIDQFMWGFQHHFRSGLESSVDHALAQLGRPTRSTAYLIGFRAAGEEARHPICVEPEDGDFSPSDFAGLDERAWELYAEDPDSGILHSHPQERERRSRIILERAIGTGIKERIEGDGRVHTVFVGFPTRVNAYLVFPVVAVATEVLEGVPTLAHTTTDEGRTRLDPSIVHASIRRILGVATRELHLPDAGAGAEIGVETDRVLRDAASDMTRGLVVLSRNPMGASLHESLIRVSTTRYEQQVGVGRLLLAPRDLEDLQVSIELKDRIRVNETRTLRKLLELSGRGGPHLVTDGDVIYGLGRLADTYRPESEAAFEIVILGDGIWDVRSAGQPLMTVRHGAPLVPEERIQSGRLADVAARVFGADDFDLPALWALVEAATEAEHGTMLVVTAAAADEAQRLSSQALAISPTRLPTEALTSVTSIDGAVLVDPKGFCHGLGVILDGTATATGDRSRGARFNSAVKYLSSTRSPTLIVIVSEDGMVDLLPDLRARIRREAINEAIQALRDAAALEPVHPERFYKAMDRVKEIAFYLSPELCDEVTRLEADHWDRRRAAGAQIFLHHPPFTPDPEMNESYIED